MQLQTPANKIPLQKAITPEMRAVRTKRVMEAGPAVGGGVTEFMVMGYMAWESVHSWYLFV